MHGDRSFFTMAIYRDNLGVSTLRMPSFARLDPRPE